MTKHTLTGSKKKVIRTSGFRARMATKHGRNILKRRRAKKRSLLVPVFSFSKFH